MKVNALTLTFDLSLLNHFQNSENIFSHIFNIISIDYISLSFLKIFYLNVSLTKSTLRSKSSVFSVDRPDIYTILDFIYFLW